MLGSLLAGRGEALITWTTVKSSSPKLWWNPYHRKSTYHKRREHKKKTSHPCRDFVMSDRTAESGERGTSKRTCCSELTTWTEPYSSAASHNTSHRPTLERGTGFSEYLWYTIAAIWRCSTLCLSHSLLTQRSALRLATPAHSSIETRISSRTFFCTRLSLFSRFVRPQVSHIKLFVLKSATALRGALKV